MKRLAEYKFSEAEKKALRKFLSRKAGTRPTSVVLKCSHSQVINLVCELAREAYQKGIKIV